MAMHTVHHRAHYSSARPGLEAGRLILTLIGAAALIVGGLLDWTRDTAATSITDRSLYQVDFSTRSDIVQTVGGLAILLGLIAVVGLIDRSGWLTRLAGALGIVLFILFAVEVYRSSDHTLQAGAWLALGGGIVLVIAGMLTPHTPADEVRTVVEDERLTGPEERRVVEDPRRDDTL